MNLQSIEIRKDRFREKKLVPTQRTTFSWEFQYFSMENFSILPLAINTKFHLEEC